MTEDVDIRQKNRIPKFSPFSLKCPYGVSGSVAKVSVADDAVVSNYSPKWRWIVVDICWAAKRRGKYPSHSPTLRWIIVLYKINLCLFVLFYISSFDNPVPSHAPVNITSTNTSSTSLLITWEHVPKKLVHGILLGYRVLYHQFVDGEIGVRRQKRAIDIVNETIEILPPNATFLRIFNLTKFTNYSFRIVGFTSKGEGKISQTFNVSTDEDSKFISVWYFSCHNLAKYSNNHSNLLQEKRWRLFLSAQYVANLAPLVRQCF